MIGVAFPHYVRISGADHVYERPAALAAVTASGLAGRDALVDQDRACPQSHQPSSLSRSSSMPKWWAISWMTVRRTSTATSSSVPQIAQIAWR